VRPRWVLIRNSGLVQRKGTVDHDNAWEQRL
jgi:hypothetical protein